MWLSSNLLLLLYVVSVSPTLETLQGNARLVDAVKALKAARSESPDALIALETLGAKLAAILKNVTPVESNVTQNPKHQSNQHEELISPETLREDEKLIVAANEALAAASSDSPDVLTALKTLGPKAAALFKSFLPIGSIMTRNPKYKELTNFHRRSDTLWRNFSKEFETSVEFFIMLFDYNMEVTDPMDYLSDYSGQYYDPNDYKRSDFMTKFERLCSNLSSYVYEVLIVREAANKYESYFNGDDTRCSFHKHNSGFNTIIGRIPFNSDDQYGKLRLGKLIEKQRAAASEVIQTIQSEMNNLYADPTLPMIADSLKEKIGKDIITNYGFSCWAIIREWRWMPCPEITYGSSPFKINDFESITTLRYKNRGEITQDCEDFRFFFFV